MEKPTAEELRREAPRIESSQCLLWVHEASMAPERGRDIRTKEVMSQLASGTAANSNTACSGHPRHSCEDSVDFLLVPVLRAHSIAYGSLVCLFLNIMEERRSFRIGFSKKKKLRLDA